MRLHVPSASFNIAHECTYCPHDAVYLHRQAAMRVYGLSVRACWETQSMHKHKCRQR